MAILTLLRPDDASGHYFRAMLAELRRHLSRKPNSRPALAPLVEWVVEEQPAHDAAVRVAEAVTGIYGLFVIEMRDSFLADVPLDMPKISWSMQQGDSEDNVIAGSATPTFEEGQLRAELALRVHLGIAMDG